VVTALVAFAVVVALAAWLVPWSWVPGGHLVPARASSLFTSAQIERAERVGTWRRALGWTSYALSFAVLAAIAFSSRGSRLVRRLVGGRRWWLAVPSVALVVLLVERLVTLPFSVASHAVELDYGTTRQGYGAWLVDVAKSLGVSWVTTSLLLLVLVGLARRWPRRWFLGAGAAALVLTFAGSFLYPVLVEPVFNRFTPMADGPFKQSVLALADQEGVTVDDVLVADASRRTTTLNAYVSGFGGTRRVVVYDNLLRDLTPAEARVVIAHELGHAKHDDVLLGTTLGSVGAVGGVALLALLLDSRRLRRAARLDAPADGPADGTVVPLVLVLVALGAFLVSPVQNTVSRAIEARADRTSLEATGEADTFVRMQRQLALTSRADPTPPAWSQLWWGSHPTVLQRAGLPASLERAGDLP
jgi:STE24 endopeptidase